MSTIAIGLVAGAVVALALVIAAFRAIRTGVRNNYKLTNTLTWAPQQPPQPKAPADPPSGSVPAKAT